MSSSDDFETQPASQGGDEQIGKIPEVDDLIALGREALLADETMEAMMKITHSQTN
jgi:hypothetical protein